MSYHAHAVGITSGTKYIVHEKEVQTIQVEGGDTTFSSVIKGKFNGKGSESNTQNTSPDGYRREWQCRDTC